MLRDNARQGEDGFGSLAPLTGQAQASTPLASKGMRLGQPQTFRARAGREEGLQGPLSGRRVKTGARIADGQTYPVLQARLQSDGDQKVGTHTTCSQAR